MGLMLIKHSSPKRRVDTDVMKMLMSDYQVTLINNKMSEFYVKFHGPAERVWKIHVELPEQFPYKSPSIGFMNKIFHPNIDELVCLDVINQTWSPMFELINIFEVFLPQLLRYPNPADPLNGEAAALLMRDPVGYAKKVESYVQRFATPEDADQAGDDESDDEEPAPRSKAPVKATAAAGAAAAAAVTTGTTASSSNGTSSNGTNGNGTNGSTERNGDGAEDGEEDDEDDDKMSDMGELSDGDEFMGEMDD